MDIEDLVHILKKYSRAHKPFRVEIIKDRNKIESLKIIDYPVLRKWKNIDSAFNDHLQNCKEIGVSFKSITGKSLIIIPCSKAKHIQDFSMKYNFNTQVKFWKYVFNQTKFTNKIFTEGAEIGYLHVKATLT